MFMCLHRSTHTRAPDDVNLQMNCTYLHSLSKDSSSALDTPNFISGLSNALFSHLFTRFLSTYPPSACEPSFSPFSASLPSTPLSLSGLLFLSPSPTSLYHFHLGVSATIPDRGNVGDDTPPFLFYFSGVLWEEIFFKSDLHKSPRDRNEHLPKDWGINKIGAYWKLKFSKIKVIQHF